MPDYYFAIGTTLAGLTNVETIISTPPHVMNNGSIGLLGPNRRVTLDGKEHRSGAINGVLQWGEAIPMSEIDTLITTFWGDYTTPNASLFISWLDESARQGVENYSPFSCEASRPEQGANYEVFNGYWALNLRIPVRNLTLQSNTENSTTSITTSERYNVSDTTGGAVTLTLPAANAVNANTVFSFTKSGGGNTLSVARAGADTIDGGTSVTVTSRTNIVSDGTSAWTSI